MRRLTVLVVALTAVACSSAPPSGSSSPAPTQVSIPSGPPTPALVAPAAQLTEYKSTVGRDAASTATDGQMNAVVAGDEAFALRLYSQLAKGAGNVFVSPYSISTSLSMVLAGARGDTASQLATVLGVSDSRSWDAGRNRLEQAIGTGYSIPPQPDPSATVQPLVLETANTMFGQTGYPFKQMYLDILGRDYGSSIQGLDFATQPDPSRLAINDWVAEQTDQRIKDLLAQGTIDDFTRAVLVNAIYFKANWLRQFSPAATQPAPFNLLNGSTVEVPTMNQTGESYQYASGHGWAAAELPYWGASMLVIVPDEGKVETVESQLNPEFIAQVDADLETRSLTLSLPKFTSEQSADLNDVLETMGATDLFDINKADLTGIADVEQLYISHVAHKANISVDEQGTEAAAATASVVEAASLPQAATLKVDRPFIYLIRDTATHEILFIGRLVDPS